MFELPSVSPRISDFYLSFLLLSLSSPTDPTLVLSGAQQFPSVVVGHSSAPLDLPG